MPTLTSELIARLKDQISGPANKAGTALDRLKRKAGTAGCADFFARMNARAAETSRSLLALGGATGAAAFAAKSYKDFAQFDRQMTRIGITADATADEIAAAKKQIRAVADSTGLEIGAVTSGLDSLTAAGRNMKEAMDFLPAVAKTAQASGADVADIASSADALGSNMKVTAGEMQQAFDMLAKAGKLGKFELRDMSQYLPAVASAAAAAGLTGLDGTRKVAAALQTVRMDTGDASSAATNLLNIFQKMGSQETEKKFMKMGMVNFRKQFDAARKSGKDMLEWILDATEKASKGDLGKVPLLFNDAQVQAGIRSLLAHREQFRQYSADIRNSAGTVAADLRKVQDDAMSGLTKLRNATDHTFEAIGSAMASSGATGAIESFAKEIDGVAGSVENYSKKIKEAGILTGIFKGYQADIEAAKNDPTAKPLLTVGGHPYDVETNRLRDERRKAALPVTQTDFETQQAQNYIDELDRRRKTGLPVSDIEAGYERQYREMLATAERRRAQAEAQSRGATSKLDAEIAAREEKKFYAEHPDFSAPARPVSPTPAGAYPPGTVPRIPEPVRRPVEIGGAPVPPPVAPQVDMGQADEAKTKVDAVQTALQELSVMNANPNVSVGGMDEAISKLQRIKSLIDNINNSSIRAPSGGGSYSDEGVH